MLNLKFFFNRNISESSLLNEKESPFTNKLNENKCLQELKNSKIPKDLENLCSKELDECKNSKELDSLGYASLEEKVETVMAPKRSILSECPTNCCRDTLRPCAQSMKVGKENDPEMLHLSRLKEERGCLCSENKTCGLEFSKKGSFC